MPNLSGVGMYINSSLLWTISFFVNKSTVLAQRWLALTAITMMVLTAVLLATLQLVVPTAGAPCDTKDFKGHHCHVSMS